MDRQQDDMTGIEKRARELFDASVESLDGRTRARLTAARRAALNEDREPRGLAWRTWAPAAVLASAALVAVLVWREQGPRSPAVADSLTSAAAVDAPLESVELLANVEDLALVENDIAFYEWLDATGFGAAGNTAGSKG